MLPFPSMSRTSSYFTHFLLHAPYHSYSLCRLFLLTLAMDSWIGPYLSLHINCGLIWTSADYFQHTILSLQQFLHPACTWHGTLPWCENQWNLSYDVMSPALRWYLRAQTLRIKLMIFDWTMTWLRWLLNIQRSFFRHAYGQSSPSHCAQ